MARINGWWLVGAALLALLAAGGGVVYHQARGIRNNNPGNIRHGRDRWQGMRDEQTDPDFIQFIAPEWGIRAMARLLLNYQALHGLRTVREIINRWAPPSENDTGAYVRHVAARLGVDPDEHIAVSDYLRPLVETIIKHENGLQPYSAATIARGLELAA